MTMIADRLREGRDLLRRGAWADARKVFTVALEASDDPAAAEGIASASWWLENDTEVTARYEDAYRGYRAAGDDRGAARVAAWLGNGALQLRGEAAVAQGWFQRAERLLADLPEGEEHGLLSLFKGMAARFRGDVEETDELAARAVEIGRRLGSPDLEVQGMALTGMARIGQGKVADGMRLLDEAAAAALAGEVREVGSVWIPTCYLVQGCEQVRDWDRAEQWRARVMDFCRRFDLGSPFSRCRTHYSTILLWRGDWAAAEAELLHAAKALRIQRPMFAAEAWVRLGELRRRQGRWEEAADLFALSRSLPAARIGQAELRLDRDDPDDALDLAGRLLEAIGGAERGPALEVFVRAGVRTKDPDVVATAVDELAEIAHASGVEAVEAAALWARGVHRAALSDTAQAIPLLENAVELYERAGGPYDAARTRLDLASALLASGRPGPAAEEARAAQDVFERLGATADARRANRLVGRAHSAPTAELTPRQVEILRLLAVGLTNAEIADRLVLSEHTVKRHVANILARLGLPTRTAAVAYGSRVGLL
ncbi:LuxR C-terminal-related transcriptional regulator [Actinoallomurus sp. CA-150999]|uniref:LuxR C-terminal-related transcriptional regulator n=1 Tax=Actinoallomurus sp. CA-150999 TaxID=3239887 RepID=UPI003D9105DD